MKLWNSYSKNVTHKCAISAGYAPTSLDLHLAPMASLDKNSPSLFPPSKVAMSVLALKRVLILCFALVFTWGVPVPAFAVPAPANKIGINVNTPLDWIGDRAFTDVIKASPQCLTQSTTPPAFDPNAHT